MNSKIIVIFIVALLLVGGVAYSTGVSKGKGDKKATESAAMMKQKDEDTAAMKRDEAAAMKKAESEAMHMAEGAAPAQ